MTDAEICTCDTHRRAAAIRFLTTLNELAAAAEELLAADREYRQKARAACRPCAGPDAGQLAAEVVQGGLSCLRPHLPYVSSGAAEQARELLLWTP